MKRAICGFLVIFTFVAVCFAQQDDSNKENEKKVILKAGTLMTAQLQDALDVQASKSNDDFVLKLTQDVAGNGTNLLKDTELLGRVVRVKPISGEDKSSEISLSFDFVKLLEDYLTFKADITTIIASDSANGSDTKGSKPDCASSPVFKGATVVSTKGKDLRLEPGSIFTLKLSRDVVMP